jgi:hypothetical protein
MARYTPSNWYWIVAGSTSQVYSSARAAYVPVTDATYVAWLAAGGRATAIDSEASLQDVLAQWFPAGWAPTLAQQATTALGAGVALVSSGTPALNGPYAIDGESRSDMLAEMVSLLANSVFTDGATTLGYADAAGVMHTFDVAQFKAFATAVASYVGALKAIAATNTGTLAAATVTIA